MLENDGKILSLFLIIKSHASIKAVNFLSIAKNTEVYSMQ